MTTAIWQLVLVAIAVIGAGTIGYLIARDRYLRQGNRQIAMMGSEVMRMRRRTQDAERDSAKFKGDAIRAQRNIRRSR